MQNFSQVFIQNPRWKTQEPEKKKAALSFLRKKLMDFCWLGFVLFMIFCTGFDAPWYSSP